MMGAGENGATRWLVAIAIVLSAIFAGSQVVRAQTEATSPLFPVVRTWLNHAETIRHVVLPNGNQLILGKAAATAEVVDGYSKKNHVMRIALPESRSFATVTVMPDGRALIWGGVDAHGSLLKNGLWFDPADNTVSLAHDVRLLPRAGHAATLLSDGRLLVTGGWSSDLKFMPEAEIWDPRTGSTQLITSPQQPLRIGHATTLLPDGRVELHGGVNREGQEATVAMAFDPATQQFRAMPAHTPLMPMVGMSVPSLLASLPTANADDFAADGVIALRFSQPMDVRSINAKTFTLLGPGGSAPVKVVGAEDGRLAFVTPTSDLLPGAHYTLFLQGVMSTGGMGLPFMGIDFAVAAQQVPTPGRQPSGQSLNAGAVPTLHAGEGSNNGGMSLANTALAGTAASKLPAAYLTTGADGQQKSEFASCGVRGGSIRALCRSTSYADHGAWYPGQDAAGDRHGGHWRLNKSDITPHEVAYAALMLRVKGGSGPTGVSGRIELIDGQAIANVDVSIGATHVRTDARGDFNLTGVAAGHQWLYVDGTTANTPGYEYGQFVVGVNLKAGIALPLSYRMYLPRILGRDKVSIPSPTTQDLVIAHPDMPGLEIHIPAGTVIKDHKGKVVTELAIVPTPVDRAPFPTAQNFPVYFSIEPAGSTVQNINPKGKQGIQIIYPNYSHLAPGTQTDFYIYHPDDDWKVYGKGRVTADGTQVIPEAGVNLVWVMGGSYYLTNDHPGDVPQTKECGACAGDPVDLWSGTLEESQTDIQIDDIIPVSLTRLFHLNALSNEARAFGSWRSNYDMYLYSGAGSFSSPSIRLPDGNLLTFTQAATLPGDVYTWTYAGSPSPWYGATLEAVSAGSYARCTSTSSAGECYLLTLKEGTQFQFDRLAPNEPTFIRDRFGNQVTLTYNGGLLQQITSPSGRFISLTYNSNNNIATATDNTGRIWSYDYTVQPNPVSPGQPWYSLDAVTYPDLTAWHYTYQTDSNAGNWGTLVSVIDRNGHHVVTNSYGQLPNSGGTFAVTNQTLADNTSYTFAHAAPVQGDSEMDVTDPNGHIRKVIMDAASGYPVSVTEAAGTAQARTVTYVRDSNGLINSMTDALLRKTTYSYDAKGNVTSITRLAGTPNAVTQQFTYTSDYSQIASYSDGLAHTTTFTYTNGCLTGIKDPLAHTTTIVCSVTGQPLSVKDALGHTTTFSYQSYDLRSVTDTLNRTMTYTTDALGRMSAVSDPLGNLSFRQYDVNDRVVKLVDPMNQVTTLVNDAMGNVTSVTLPNTRTIGYLYDARNRLIKRTDALTQFESWTPDGMGNVLSYTDRKGQSTTYQYDALDRRILTNYADSSTIAPTYDAGDRVTALSDSVSGNQSFGYDGLDRLTQAVNPQATVAYTYDAAGRRKTMVAGTQASVGYTYDNANRITKLTQGSETVSLSYDNANRRSLLTLPNGVTVTYAYDNANQLTGITYKQASSTVIGNLGYGYDNAGRRVIQTGTLASDTLPTATTQPSTFDFNNRLTAFNGKAQTYDADGNLTGDGTNNYVWNARNQLVQVKQGSLVIATYVYDALGRRLSKAVNGSTAITFLYDGLNPVRETQGTTVTPLLTGLGIDERFARTEPSGRTYFLTDALGSTIGLTDTTGNLVQRYQYDPYGEMTAQNLGFTNPYQYTGRENDGNGLYFYRARYYSPMMKRFVGEDPVGFGGGQANFYAYVSGDPLSEIDPSGLSTVTYDGSAHTVTYTRSDGTVAGTFPANNITTRSSNGSWPNGTFNRAGSNPHPESDANGAYGSHGIIIFDVPGRTGMGLHSGRVNSGAQNHPTLGCIRTTDDSMGAVRNIEGTDPVTSMTVVNNDPNAPRQGAQQ